MNKKILLISLILLSFKNFAQINFEIGYFISNNGQKTDCLIKDVDSKNNPQNFEYKLTKDSKSKYAGIDKVKEFGILGKFKYLRFDVEIDKSTNFIQRLTKYKQPKFVNEQLFLNVLIEGKASLYLYRKDNLIRFFHKMDNENIQQLVYKKYLKEDKNEHEYLAENNNFKQQLLNELKCKDISIKNIQNINYKIADLTKLYKLYNTCENNNAKIYKKSNKKDLFNLTIRPGIRSTSFKMSNSVATKPSESFIYDTDFDNELNFRFGIEFEIRLPFRKNKWSVFLEPYFETYKSEKEITYLQTSTISRKSTVKIDYSSINFNGGIRHYSYLNNNSKLFLNALITLDTPSSNNIIAEREGGEGNLINLDVNSDISVGFGFGYQFREKHNIEIRISSSNILAANYVFWNSNYNNISFIYGYTIF